MLSFSGVVIKGKRRGRTLNFPTANVALPFYIDEGIYISSTKISDMVHHSLTFIGAAKTFDEVNVLAETYLFDFNNDIYGEIVSISLIEKIRENQKFTSQEDLLAAMESDKKVAEKYFQENQVSDR